jgi:DNA polymerase elongation subunit (family B)
MKPTAFFDVECYRNFFLVLMKRKDDGQVLRFQQSPNRQLNIPALRAALQAHRLVGFNSTDYDLPMIQLALTGVSTQALKRGSDDIIVGGMRARDFASAHDLPPHNWDHVDLIQVAPLQGSLKIYAGRLHCRKMQDLPIDPAAEITAEQAPILIQYCENDLDNTALLAEELDSQLALRESLSKEYGQDLRSRSDAQLAEHIIASEITKLTGQRPARPPSLEGRLFRYNVPAYVVYSLPPLQGMLATIRSADFMVGDTGAVVLPAELMAYDIRIGGGKYRIGIGGLHSAETCVGHVADEHFVLSDRDVTSYYPRIILNQGLYPKHLGPGFLKVYDAIVERRVAAKKARDVVTAESLKIAVNGSFGKLGSKWSVLYAPDLLIQVTLTGQLSLLMLIEMVEAAGIPVVSANTDGIVMKCPRSRQAALDAIVCQWESITGFTTEETRYRALHSKDVNNYIAIKEDGSVKGKGLYANPWEKEGPNVFKLHKNPGTTIVIEAVVALLRDGTPLEDTVRACRDIRKFAAVRTVNGGATVGKEHLGKAVRWYYATGRAGQVLTYLKSGNKVPKSDGSKPLMELPAEFPADVNYHWYVKEANSVLGYLGYAQGRLFEAA